jgi:succinate dehydrogenase/fumarate reductase flavoprotein subunit
MSENVWILKSGKKLKIAIETLKELRNNASLKLKLREKTYLDLKEAWETLNMVEVAQVLAQTSFLRTESRGAHYRDDYPEQDDKNWLKNIIFYKKGNNLKWHAISNDPVEF